MTDRFLSYIYIIFSEYFKISLQYMIEYNISKRMPPVIIYKLMRPQQLAVLAFPACGKNSNNATDTGIRASVYVMTWNAFLLYLLRKSGNSKFTAVLMELIWMSTPTDRSVFIVFIAESDYRNQSMSTISHQQRTPTGTLKSVSIIVFILALVLITI